MTATYPSCYSIQQILIFASGNTSVKRRFFVEHGLHIAYCFECLELAICLYIAKPSSTTAKPTQHTNGARSPYILFCLHGNDRLYNQPHIVGVMTCKTSFCVTVSGFDYYACMLCRAHRYQCLCSLSRIYTQS